VKLTCASIFGPDSGCKSNVAALIQHKGHDGHKSYEARTEVTDRTAGLIVTDVPGRSDSP